MYAIVMGQRGQVRDALTALLHSMPEVELVSTTEFYEPAEQLIEMHGRVLVVLQISSPDDQTIEWVSEIKARSTSTKILALVSEATMQPQYVAAGVDSVMVEGESLEKLQSVIDSLVTGK